MLRPFQKSHNTAFRLFTALLYGLELGSPYLDSRGRTGRYQHLALRTGPCAYSMRMTIPRMREHLEWLQACGLLSDVEQVDKGLIHLTLKLPE